MALMISLRHKIWLGFGGLLLVLVIVSAMCVLVLTRYSHALDQVFRENYDSALYCDGMKSALDALNNQAQRMVWRQETASPEQTTAASITRFESNLSRQSQNCTLPNELRLTQQLQDLWSQYKDRYEQFQTDPRRDPAVYRQELLPRYEQLRQSAQAIADMNMNNMVSVDGTV